MKFTSESEAAILGAALAWRMALDAYDPFDGRVAAWDNVERLRTVLDATIRKAEIKDDDSGTTVAS